MNYTKLMLVLFAASFFHLILKKILWSNFFTPSKVLLENPWVHLGRSLKRRTLVCTTSLRRLFGLLPEEQSSDHLKRLKNHGRNHQKQGLSVNLSESQNHHTGGGDKKCS
jgi:hypothetical protein